MIDVQIIDATIVEGNILTERDKEFQLVIYLALKLVETNAVLVI